MTHARSLSGSQKDQETTRTSLDDPGGAKGTQGPRRGLGKARGRPGKDSGGDWVRIGENLGGGWGKAGRRPWSEPTNY